MAINLYPPLLEVNLFPPSTIDRKLYALPLTYGGMGIPILCDMAKSEYDDSKRITGPLAAIICMQGNSLPDKNEVKLIKKKINQEKEVRNKAKEAAIEEALPANTNRCRKFATEKGASAWLSVLPLTEHGLTLNKGEFRDAIALRYGKKMQDLPSTCPCGKPYDLNHALNCK